MVLQVHKGINSLVTQSLESTTSNCLVLQSINSPIQETSIRIENTLKTRILAFFSVNNKFDLQLDDRLRNLMGKNFSQILAYAGQTKIKCS